MYNLHKYHKVRLKWLNPEMFGFREFWPLIIPIILSLSLLPVNTKGDQLSSTNNNRPPQFLIEGQSEIVIRLKEGPETPIDTLIYTLRGYDPDNDTLTFGKRQSPDSEVIRIENHQETNEAFVYLAKSLDRETQNEYSIVLTLTDQHLHQDHNYVTQSLLLLVEDINDNAPIFRPYQGALDLAENSEPGVIATLEAQDADEGAFGQVVYYLQELEGDNDMFSISTYQGKGVLRLVGNLDYETKILYQLRILAVDRANQAPINTGTAAILVRVTDVEDQPPEFVRIQPVARIAEDAAIGTRVMRIHCIDGDRGINNPITYQLESNELFAIDPSSGWITTIAPLDREDASNQVNGAYILKITATEIYKNSYNLSESVVNVNDSHPLSLSTAVVKPLSQVKTEVTVLISDVNDQIPTFGQSLFRCEINENAQLNTPINFMDGGVSRHNVSDRDWGRNGTFQLFLEPANGYLEVSPAVALNEATFILKVKDTNVFDYEMLKEINYTLYAREIDEPKHFSVSQIQIYIRDQNDNFPEFNQTVYNVSLMENSEVGTVITKIQAIDIDSNDFGTLGIRYKNLRGDIAHLLHLDAITGVISIKKAVKIAFDREMVSHHYLTVEAIDNLGLGNRNTALLIIEIKDINDNAPIFLQRQYEVPLLENRNQFEYPLQLEARDNDLNDTENSKITYEIVDGMYRSHFTIDPELGILEPVEAFDFEELSEHVVSRSRKRRHMERGIHEIDLLIRARDSGIPMLSTVVPVLVYVHDVNDNPPIFQKNFYHKLIPEDAESGSSVLQLMAIDRDGSMPNNEIVYRIQEGAQDKFIINSQTGVISVAPGANLDPDLTPAKIQNYSMKVLALDGGIGNSQLMNIAMVNISIEDVNNKVPTLDELPVLYISENMPLGQEIYKLKAQDADHNPILRYSILPANCEARNEDGVNLNVSTYDYISAFDLNAIEGSLKILQQLDRETIELIKLAIRVEDLAAAKGRQILDRYLTIHVLDENDNSPEFKQSVYKLTIPENSMNGVLIGNIIALDKDKNRTISYSLMENNPSMIRQLIHLDSQSGALTVAHKIDHEQWPWLNFTVCATDSGIPARSTLVDVSVAIIDENDNNPYFLGGIKNYTISELAAIGSRVATVQARDLDSGEYGRITYLMDRLSSQGKFTIDSESGIVSLIDRLDRETTDVYTLIIEAWDNYQMGFKTGESRNAFKQIIITVLDENDNSPEVSLPRTCSMITEYHDLKERILTITGTDKDDPETVNGRLEFRITKGNDKDLFELKVIDSWTVILLARVSLRNRYGNHSLELTIRDLGVPSLSITRSLDICITDYNDHSPVFLYPLQNTTIRVPENITIGTEILQVMATDEDIGVNALVRYRLKPDPLGSYKHFQLDGDSGRLTLKEPLNRAKQKLHEIRIEAYDQGLPASLSSDLDIIVYVRKIEEYEPQFIIDEINVNFTEESEIGVERVKLPDTIDNDELLIELEEIDDDEEQQLNHQRNICYFIICGNEDNVFQLDPETHILTTRQVLDREVKDEHIIYIKATENCLITESERANLLSMETGRARRRHSSSFHHFYDGLSFQYNENYNRFTLSRNLRSTPIAGDEMLNDESNESNVDNCLEEEDILMSDGAVVRVRIQVLDINDNPPRFISSMFTGGITTNANFGANFMRVEAIDRDVGENSRLTYYLMGDIRQTLSEGMEHLKKAPFLLVQRTGEITLNFDPQKGMKGYFDFMVLANDSLGMKDVAHVYIYLLREDQKVRFVFRLQPDELREKLFTFRETLSNITGAIVNIDELKVHDNQDGSVDNTKTDLYLHLVSTEDNSIYEVEEVLHLIDSRIELLDKMFKDMNVLDTQPAEMQYLSASINSANTAFVWLVFTNLFLATLLIVTVAMCVSQRNEFHKKLRAANMGIGGAGLFHNSPFGLQNTLESTVRVPNTNKHCLQGSNPIWLKGYGSGSGWLPADEDTCSQTGPDSLDDNFLSLAGHNGEETNKSLTQLVFSNNNDKSNDFNHQYNVCNQMDKFSNSNINILSKKLETTEL